MTAHSLSHTHLNQICVLFSLPACCSALILMLLGLAWDGNSFTYTSVLFLSPPLLGSVVGHCGIHSISTVLQTLYGANGNQKAIFPTLVQSLLSGDCQKGIRGQGPNWHLSKVKPAPVLWYANWFVVQRMMQILAVATALHRLESTRPIWKIYFV